MAKAKGLRKTKSEEEVAKVKNEEDVATAEVTNEEGEKEEITVTGNAQVDAKDLAEFKEEEDEVVQEQKEVTKVAEVQIQDLKVKSANKGGSEPNVRIKVNKDVNTYIGDRWYNIKKGKVATVPQSVKIILNNAGFLDAL